MIRVEGLTQDFHGQDRDGRGRGRRSISRSAPGEMVTLLGPSGCGKTTTLRCIAGLEKADAGRIVIGDRPVVDVAAGVFVPPHQRNLGMVFQSYAIWPHMTVLENVAYALEGRRMSKAERTRSWRMEALETVQARAPRRPAGAAALGRPAAARRDRARLVGQPQVLLFDEPLSQSRRQAAARDAQRAAPHPAPDRAHLGLRHPRPGRSAGGLRLDRGDEGRPHRRARPAARHLSLSAPRLHGAVPRHHQPDRRHGRERRRRPAGSRSTTALGRIVGIDPTRTLAAGAACASASGRRTSTERHAGWRRRHAGQCVRGAPDLRGFRGRRGGG